VPLWFYRAVFLTGILAVAVLSLLPQEAIPGVEQNDKVLHVLAYFLLGASGRLAFPSIRSLWLLILGLILFGGAIELAQGLVGRDPSEADALVNILGTVLGAMIASLAPRPRRQMRLP
jgi:VanZ family protein